MGGTEGEVSLAAERSSRSGGFPLVLRDYSHERWMGKPALNFRQSEFRTLSIFLREEEIQALG